MKDSAAAKPNALVVRLNVRCDDMSIDASRETRPYVNAETIGRNG